MNCPNCNETLTGNGCTHCATVVYADGSYYTPSDNVATQLAHEHTSGMHDSARDDSCFMCANGTGSRRYVVSVNITITATDETEAQMLIERALAGVAEHDVVDTFAEDVDARAN